MGAVASRALAEPAEPVVELSEAVQELISPEPLDTPVENEPEPEKAPEPVEVDMSKVSKDDIEKVKEELVQEMLQKLEGPEGEGLIVQEIVTAPYDPRFPATNQARHCFIRYNEYYKCLYERGREDERCKFYSRAYQSLCPQEWVEEWEELREQGLWMGKY